jgi:hypothetical protein
MNSAPLKKHLEFLRAYGNLQPSHCFHYVTIHPLADDKPTLKRLNLTPDRCFLCDLYLATQRKLAFISIVGKLEAGESPAVRYRRQSDEVPHRFVVTTRNLPLTSAKVESAVARIVQWLEVHGGDKGGRPRYPSTIIEEDIVTI